VSRFALDWLALREPVDPAARNRVILAQVAAAFSDRDSVRVVDLGSGAGSTLRALAPHLPPGQSWTLVDNDADLLAAAAAAAAADSRDTAVTTKRLDLAGDLEKAFAGGADLVTTSALLDLVSADWLNALVRQLAARRLPLYAALTYDGFMQFTPDHPLDDEAVVLFNQHQTRNKGLGDALGPQAVEAASERLRLDGAMVTAGRSDWRLEPHGAALQRAFLEGMAAAVRETGGLAGADLDDWQRFRLQSAAQSASIIQVGHVDLFARF
jgi:SAM-dependent methyltransferase